MKKIVILIGLIVFNFAANAQETVAGKVAGNVKGKSYQKVEQKGDEAIDKTLNKVEDGIKGLFKKKDKKKKKDSEEAENNSNQNQQSNSNQNKSSTNKTAKPEIKNSKFDFEPGQKQLAFDDFSTTKIGDFPLNWNTNSSAEIVTFDKDNQKWLSITSDGYFQPDFINEMPLNFTLEFEVYARYKSSNILSYQLYLIPSKNPKKDLAEEYLDNYFQFAWSRCNNAASFLIVENGETINSNGALKIADAGCDENHNNGEFSKFSIWRQNGRLRIYVNENKVVDLPQAFDLKQKYNVFKIGAKYMNFSTSDNLDEFMISNVRYAVAGEDTRSKLITEGRFVTNGIQFDVNSDNIKPESGTVLKEIATTLKENPKVRVKIIGHTDSDGADAANLQLSQKRAAAVKTALSSFYDIDGSRIETDGKGESQPLNKNATPVEKASNRRVEFLKL